MENKNTTQEIVLRMIEGGLTVYFWIGVVFVGIVAYNSASLLGAFHFGTFLFNLFIYLLGLASAFYIFFFLKDIREKLTIIAQNSYNEK